MLGNIIEKLNDFGTRNVVKRRPISGSDFPDIL